MLVSTPHLVARHSGVSDLTPETPEPLRGGDADSSAESDGEAADGARGEAAEGAPGNDSIINDNDNAANTSPKQAAAAILLPLMLRLRQMMS